MLDRLAGLGNRRRAGSDEIASAALWLDRVAVDGFSESSRTCISLREEAVVIVSQTSDSELIKLVRAIVDGDADAAARLLAVSPDT